MRFSPARYPIAPDRFNLTSRLTRQRQMLFHQQGGLFSPSYSLLPPSVLGGLAEFERELIRARTGDGRKRAKDRGVRFGRPAALTRHQRQEALQRLANGEVQADVARSYDVSQATISRLQA